MSKKKIVNSFLYYVSLVFVVGFVVQNGVYLHTLYNKHVLQQNKAIAYLQSDVCSQKMRHKLDNYNLCDQSEMIISMSPMLRALTDVLGKWHICANERCSIVYYDITENLYQIVFFVLVFLVILVQLSRLYLSEQQRRDLITLYSLPGNERKYKLN